VKRDEIIILCGTRTKEEVERAAAYLVQQFPMARDAKLHAREADEDDPSYVTRGTWLAVISGKDWGRYTGTIEKMRQAVQDYENGWRDAKKAR